MTTKMTEDDPRHGTPNGYGNLRCRCQPCRDAWSGYYMRYSRKRRAKLVAKGLTQRGSERKNPLPDDVAKMMLASREEGFALGLNAGLELNARRTASLFRHHPKHFLFPSNRLTRRP